MTGFIKAHGRTPAGWDEIVAAKPEASTIVFWWRHDKPELLTQALANGYPVVLTPRSPCYFDYPQDKSYPSIGRNLTNTSEAVYLGPAIPTNMPASQFKQILGVEGCIWTEHIATVPYLEFMTMPRLAALAEMAWSTDSRRDFTQFNARLKPFLNQYRKLGIHCYDETNPTGSLREAQQTNDANARFSLSEK
jgi:hexosaminidase